MCGGLKQVHALKLNAVYADSQKITQIIYYESLSFSHVGKFIVLSSGISFTELHNKKYVYIKKLAVEFTFTLMTLYSIVGCRVSLASS